MAYQLRDRHGASRAVAYLCSPPLPSSCSPASCSSAACRCPAQLAVIFTSLVHRVFGAWGCWFRPDRLPDYFWLIAPFLAATLISGLNLITSDASTGAQLFYLWPVLYAANFLSRRVIYAEHRRRCWSATRWWWRSC